MLRRPPAVLAALLLALLATLTSIPASASAKKVDPDSRVLAAPTIGQPGVRVVIVKQQGDSIQIPYYKYAGWWKGSRPLMAKKGSSVIVGHVSDDHDNPGVFYHLDRAKIGDRFKWRMGKNYRTFEVVRRQVTHKGQLPQRIFNKNGKRRVHLVSCYNKTVYPNGRFHYQDNLTITAKPVKN